MKKDIENLLVPKQEVTETQAWEVLGEKYKITWIELRDNVDKLIEFLNKGYTLDEIENNESTQAEVKRFMDTIASEGIFKIGNKEYVVSEKPVIPKFVADYLCRAKADVTLMRVMELANTRNELPKWKKEYDWISENSETFARAWLDGYEVEKEQKYYADVGGDTSVYTCRRLKSLLVPKQEELESKIKVLIEAYKQEDGAYSNPENGWISGFVEDLENLVEEEPEVLSHELPVIPEYVAEWITQYRKVFDLYPALKRLENNSLIWERVYKWYRINTHKFVNAYLTGKYEVEEKPLYYALIKGHEFPSGLLSLHDGHLTKMSKEDWNVFGINDSNADFIKMDEELN